MSRQVKNWARLTAIVIVVGCVWMVVLPFLQHNSALQKEIQFLDEQGIDPSALYYTDLEVMSKLEANVMKAKEQNPQAFWIPFSRGN